MRKHDLVSTIAARFSFTSHASVIRTELCLWTTSRVRLFSLVETVRIGGTLQIFTSWGALSVGW